MLYYFGHPEKKGMNNKKNKKKEKKLLTLNRFCSIIIHVVHLEGCQQKKYLKKS